MLLTLIFKVIVDILMLIVFFILTLIFEVINDILMLNVIFKLMLVECIPVNPTVHMHE